MVYGRLVFYNSFQYYINSFKYLFYSHLIFYGTHVMDNQEAVNFVSEIKDPQIAAKQLTVEALKREIKDDYFK